MENTGFWGKMKWIAWGPKLEVRLRCVEFNREQTRYVYIYYKLHNGQFTCQSD